MTSEVDFVNIFKLGIQPAEEIPPYVVSYDDIVFNVISIGTRVLNICLNVALAVDYYGNYQHNYFVLTTLCIIVPAVVTTVIQIVIFRKELSIQQNRYSGSFKGKWRKLFISKIIFPFLFRYYHSLKYAINSKRAQTNNDFPKQKRYYEKMVREDSDVALLRIFEGCFELAPQKTLQISVILANNYYDSIFQILSIGSSLLSLAWLMVSHDKYARLARNDQLKMTPWGILIRGIWQFLFIIFQILSVGSSLLSLAWLMVSHDKYARLARNDQLKMTPWGILIRGIWQFLFITSRVLSISIMASIFPIETIIAACVHAVAMTQWIFIFNCPQFVSGALGNYIMSIAFGFVYIFNYYTTQDGRNRWKYAFFYTLCGLENAACILFSWYFLDNVINIYLYHYLWIAIVSCFLLSIIFQVIYYSYFHPNLTK